MKPIIATLPAEAVHNGKNYEGEKEVLSTWNVVAFRDGEYYELVTLAIRSAGITLSASIDGGGDRMIEEALGAIAQALGFDRVIIVKN